MKQPQTSKYSSCRINRVLRCTYKLEANCVLVIENNFQFQKKYDNIYYNKNEINDLNCKVFRIQLSLFQYFTYHVLAEKCDFCTFPSFSILHQQNQMSKT